jgi:hypothetical protein
MTLTSPYFSFFQSFLHALYNLAANLQYVEPLREEIESIVKSEGWSKGALGKMIKLDSFLKESARFVPDIAGTFTSIKMF